MRDMDDIVVVIDLDLLKLSDAGADPQLAMKRLGAGISVDALGIPAVDGKSADGFAETAGDIEEPPSAFAGERREKAIGALSACLCDRAPVGPFCGSFAFG